ncbi:MAG TPA: cation transporter [Ktedonobacterales bacterium]|jgi:copper chaperone
METTAPREITLSVPDVSCEHCVKTVSGALGALPSVEAINVDLASKTVRLRYEPTQVTLERIEKTLDDAGYTVAK